MRKTLAFIAAVFVLALPLGLHAEAGDEAMAAFEKGKSFFKQSKYLEAAGAFREAYKQKPNWKLLFNIAQSEAAAKRHGLALEAFERYLTEGGDDIASDRYNGVLSEVKRLRDVVGTVEVRAPDGAVIIIDNLERGLAPLPGPLLIAAGIVHRLIVKNEGKIVIEKKIRVSGQKTLIVDVDEEKESAAAEEIDKPAAPKHEEASTSPQSDDQNQETDAVSSPKESPSVMKILGGVSLGLGGAMVVAGAITGGKALSLSGELSDDCPQGICSEEFWSENNSLKSLTTATNILLGVGTGLAATGFVLLLVDRNREKNDSGISLVPLAGPALVGVDIKGRF